MIKDAIVRVPTLARLRRFLSGLLALCAVPLLAPAYADTVGVPVTGAAGITETVDAKIGRAHV